MIMPTVRQKLLVLLLTNKHAHKQMDVMSAATDRRKPT